MGRLRWVVGVFDWGRVKRGGGGLRGGDEEEGRKC